MVGTHSKMHSLPEVMHFWDMTGIVLECVVFGAPKALSEGRAPQQMTSAVISSPTPSCLHAAIAAVGLAVMLVLLDSTGNCLVTT